MAGETQKTNVAPIPSFADVLRTNALKAMNIRSAAGTTPSTGVATNAPQRPLPSPRSYADGGARRLASGVRLGQSLDNSVMTSPGSYSPFLTIQAQQTPNARQMEYTYAQWWYTNEPRVAAAIDFYSTFPLSGFSLECGNPYVKEYFDDLIKKLNLQKWLPLVAHEYYLRGDVFILASLDCKHCGGLSYDKKTGEPCTHDGATWGNLCILNPDRIEATPAMLGQEPTYYYLPNEDMKRVVTTGEPKHIYDSIPDELKQIIASDQPIYFNDVSLWHLKHGAAPFQNFGQSLVRRCFMTLAYKDKLRQAQWIIAERHILPIKIVKIGDKDRPASDEDLEAAQEQLANLANSPLYTIITHDAWDMDFVGACHDDITEVLTETGFVPFSQLSTGVNVACYNPLTGFMEWHTPREYHKYHYDSSVHGQLFDFHGKQINVSVTPNHEMWSQNRVWNNDSKKYNFTDWTKTPACEIKEFNRFLTTSSWQGNLPSEIPYKNAASILSEVNLEDFLSLAGYYISEGCQKVEKGKANSLFIYQKQSTDSQRKIESVLRRCFGEKTKAYSIEFDKWETVTQFAIHNRVLSEYFGLEFGHLSQNKRIPRWMLDLPASYLKVLLEALMLGDGDSRENGSRGERFRYSTTSPILANAVQEIALKLGYWPQVKSGENRSEKHHLPIYRVYWTKVQETRGVRSRNITRRDYLGDVYCVTVPTGVLITRRNGTLGIHGNTGKFATVTQEFEQIEQELLDGFMLNKGMLNGEGPSIQGAQIGLLITDRRLEQFRREVAYWLEERLFKPISQFNGFVEEGERGQEKPVYPTVKWDDLKLRDDTGKLQIIAQLQQAGIVDSQTLLEMLGLNYDQIVERLRYENAANSANSPGIIGGGYGGPLGGGQAGGGMGAMPPMGGGGAFPMGGDAGMGGAAGPPPGAGGMGMGMAPMASTNPEENYRIATSVIHEVFTAQNVRHAEVLGVRTAGVKPKSVAHEGFLRSISAVTGRGSVGELPKKMDEIFPMEEVGPTLGGYDAIPLNRAAHIAWGQAWGEVKNALDTQREVTAQAKGKQPLPPKMLFTKLEQELYKVLGQANIPYALFAQYSAGPNQKYQLDAAFPALRLGIEADSEMYHNSPQKIAQDRSRDMELASQGWTVLRFTEQEIHRQPHEILGVVIQVIKKLAAKTSKSGVTL